MSIINGKKIAEQLKEQIKQQVKLLVRKPGLAIILIGDDPASQIYVNNKEKACKIVGFYSQKIIKSADINQNELLKIIKKLNQDERIDGILVQLPLPKHLDIQAVISKIDASKDVDGFHTQNAGKLFQNNSFLRPCTPKGVMYLLEKYAIEVSGKYCVIVGASNIVGRPMAIELLNAGGTITVCNSKTPDLSHHLKQADIVVIGIGKPNFIKKSMLNSNCVVIDVGINCIADGSLTGDVDFKSVKNYVRAITPVPGGVGPMTIASLLENTLIAYKNREKK